MAISDFIRKQARIARDDGPVAAIRRGASEAAFRACTAAMPLVTTPIWAGEWDVCLVLDACRADLFREVAPEYGWLPDTPSTSWSVGSASPEWIGHTFGDRHSGEWSTAGYVTANPFSGKRGDELGVLDPDVYPLSDRGLGYLDEVWRDQWPCGPDLPTVAPGVLTDRALWTWRRREQVGIDRLVVHYMQPHIPFRSRPEWCDGWDLEGFGTGGGKGKDSWHQVRDGEIEAGAFWAAYRDNLRWVLGEVARWYRGTEARILITSDHGNGMGEWGVWSHPPRNAAPALRRVPWVTVQGVNVWEPQIEPAGDPPVTAGSERAVDEQLEALGYK